MDADNSVFVRPNPRGNVRIRMDWEDNLSVVSVLHKLVDELNRPHLHAEIDQPDEPETEVEEQTKHA